MSPLILFAVLGSAVLHSGWNAIAKAIPSRLAASALIGATYAVIGAVAIFFVPALNSHAIPYLVASTILQTAYMLVLTASYRTGDFSRVYPLARGSSIVVVAIFSILVLGERFRELPLLGLVITIAAITSLAVPSLIAGGEGVRRSSGLALITGLIIGGYSLIDGIGVRASGSALSYAAWLFLSQGVVLVITVFVIERRRQELLADIRRHAPLGALGGAMSVVAYGLVLVAQSVAPLALVSAVRETSVVMAAVIGVIVFRERATISRLVAITLVVVGIALLQLG